MAKQNKGKPRNSILLQIKSLLICSPFIYLPPIFICEVSFITGLVTFDYQSLINSRPTNNVFFPGCFISLNHIFISGILPLYSWIGNPFCWACYPLRVCVVLPAGFLYCVLALSPAMGVAINRLFKVAPQMKDEMGTIASTIWTFGLFFWGIIFLLTFLYWYFCGKCLCMLCCPCERKEKADGSKEGCLCC